MNLHPFPTDGYEFGLCLTHDVDRPYKNIQAPYYALRDCSLHHLRALRPGRNPWWTFDRIVRIESDLDVRSVFYFLREPHLLRERSPVEWLRPYRWIEHAGRYDPSAPDVASLIHQLDRGGWEVGLHGSLDTHRNAARLDYEKRELESVLGHEVSGCRQHWLRLDPPETWQHQVDLGLRYDASLGSNDRVGFHYGYHPYRPFDDDFVVFPLTIMDTALAKQTNGIEEARETCEALLQEAREHGAVMTVLWHPRFFAETDFPGQADLYRYLVKRARTLDAWIGPPADLQRQYL